MKQDTELACHVYSVVRLRTDEAERVVNAYLYSHTSVVESLDDGSGTTYAVLRTTATTVRALDPVDIYDAALASDVRKLVQDASRLAHYQVDRFKSGLYAGQVCGTQQDATTYISNLHATTLR